MAAICLVGTAACATDNDSERTRPHGGNSGGGPNSGGAGGGPPVVIINTLNCGNGVLDMGEQCDNPGSLGCSAICQLADGWLCPADGSACTQVGVCGDGMLTSNEVCDDGNTADGDGCAGNCQAIDLGYQCRVPGRLCVPACGDGMIVGTERCDDNNRTSRDGCSSSCLIEPGFMCSGTPTVCVPSVCGNGVTETGEGCDAGELNGLFYGNPANLGCSKTCTEEPVCRSGTGMVTTRACDTSCGNGARETGEECDDGNLSDGDGCSSTCTIEPGFDCMNETLEDTETCSSGPCLRLPVILRDFKSERESGGHPDFFYHGAAISPPISVNNTTFTNPTHGGTVSFSKRYCVPNTAGPAKQNDSVARSWDLALANLDPSGKPAFNTSRNGGGANATLWNCQFTDWSHNDNGGHVPGYGDASATAGRPLNGLPYVGGPEGRPQYRGWAPIVTSAQSFGQWWVDSQYTSNTHTVIALELAATAGGLYQYSSASHSLYGGFFPLDPANNVFPLYSPTGSMAGPGAVRTSTTGNNEPLLCNIWPYWYSSAQFGAGNNCQGRQYILPPTASAANCNITDPNNMSWLQGCWMNNDMNVQGWFHNSWFTTEARYLVAFNGTPFTLEFFGDDDLFIFINGVLVVDLGGVHQRLPGRVQVSAAGVATIVEGGALNPATGQINPCPGTDPYTMQATVAVGDCRSRTVNLGLEAGRTYEIAIFHADRGAPESNYQLTLSGFQTERSNCTPRCGDGVVTGAEECDCGDGTQLSQPPECGGAVNDDTVYGGCTTECLAGPYCGDGMVNGPEECDSGTQNNTGTYGAQGSCTPACQWAHYCGDGNADLANGEGCDLGANNGMPGQPCSATCTIVPT